MSVIGIDFGSESCYIAVARAGGIETIDNDYSQRNTPSYVGFGQKQRVLGVAAKNQQTTNIENTINGFKRFLGLQYDDQEVQEARLNPAYPFKIVNVDGMAGYEVKCFGEKQKLNAVQVSAMMLTKLKEISEHAINAKVHDCVVSVPSYFTDLQRRSLLAACEVAGLNVLRLLNETTATALNYGIYKQELPPVEEKPRNVVFVDCGHTALQVAVCAFNEGKLKMLATAFDSNIGGRDFDELLGHHFSEEFKKKYNIDPTKNSKAYVRLITEVQKIKKQMSANSGTLHLGIESFMDKDVHASIKREDFENMSANLFKRIQEVFRQCLESSNLKLDEIHSVEIVGGSTRIPAIKNMIKDVFGRDPSTTLNQDEAVARGCALQCAILSPAFKVRDFCITDIQPYPIKVIWESGPDGEMEVFPQYHPAPFSRMLTFYRKESFSLKAVYNCPVPIRHPDIGLFSIDNVRPAANGDASKVKVKVRINMNGIFCIPSASLLEKIEDEEPMEAEPTHNAPNEEPPQENQPSENASEEMVTEPSGGEEKNEKRKASKKQQYTTLDLPVFPQQVGLSKKQSNEMFEIENEFIVRDKAEQSRMDAKNAFEEYVYDLRDKLDYDLADFVEEGTRVSLKEYLRECEDWLYGEGEELPKSVYQDKLTDLKKQAEPIKEREIEHHERPKAIRELELSLILAGKVVQFIYDKDPRYEHLTEDDAKKLSEYIKEDQQWLDHTREILHSVQKHMTAPIKSSEIMSRKRAFDSKAHPIMQKPKPKVEPPKESKPSSAENDSANANANNTKDKNGESQPQENHNDDMEVD